MQTAALPLRHVARCARSVARRPRFGWPSRIRTSVHGFKVRCPTIRRRGNGQQRTRAKKWSGRRDSNPRPSPWQGDALPTEPLPLDDHRLPDRIGGAESQDRTGDTAIFSRVLYRLSYLGPMVAPRGCRRRRRGYHGVSAARHRAPGHEGGYRGSGRTPGLRTDR